MNTPCLLAFDTSTELLALGLQSAAGCFVQHAAGGALASAALLPLVQTLLARAGVALADVDAIAFGRGPGAFTGLRTSCAVAQGLALGLDRPVLPIDSLLILAEDAHAQALVLSLTGPADDFDIGVAMDARMDEAYAARYRRTPAGWQVLDAPALYTQAALADAWSAQPERAAPGWLAGSALAAFGDRLDWPASARRLPVEHDRATALLRLAARAWADGLAIPGDQALPLYLRDKVASTTAEREALRRAAAGAGEAVQ